MASSEKRCLYEVLGLSRDCAADEIRSAYRRLALQRHPDKLVQSGVPEAEATAAFQELVNAYEVLSDPRERAWYDSHRNQILFSSSTATAAGGSSAFVPDLFTFFSNSVYSGYSDSGRGFYKVYADLFEKIYANELNFAKKLGLPLPKEAPVMGNLESPYAQARARAFVTVDFVSCLRTEYFTRIRFVNSYTSCAVTAYLFMLLCCVSDNAYPKTSYVTAFYSYWFGFASVLDFFWADQYDAMAGPNRKSRRLMEEENKKLRKKARREYNETVRGLAEFVKKRDKRVIDMQIKRNEEMERKREEEKQRKKELERQKAEKARNYEEPEWAKVEEFDEDEDEDEDALEEKKNEFYCVACSKKFRSDKQWKNHEQSKKHKEKVAELRNAFREEDEEYEAEEADEMEEANGNDAGYLSADDGVSKLQEQFEGGLGVQEDDSDDGKNASSEAEEFEDPKDHSGGNGVAEGMGSDYDDDDDDDEASILEAMLSGRRSRNKARNQPKDPATKTQTETDGDELDFMEYNDTKGSRRNKGGRRRRGRRQEAAETVKTSEAGRKDEAEEPEGCDDDAGESISQPLPESETIRAADDAMEKDLKHVQQAVNKKSTTKKENASKSKVASKGRKQKVATRSPDNLCEKCGEQFESKNKLHKHLGETGHASLRSR
ncbi:hypothetical protein C2S53_009089 [Perilla frutescens var. hirtella]|uniref:Uncharacterized protein n=1 Tax=Perilla frutescens var. hirtella TaxID=608512 RepID=A0AAD4NX44_PERFH|nr:hypothetical protein C2S53_009089 [Perilla frutescens var. hirtella]